MCISKLMTSIEHLKHLQIPFLEISLATNGFSKENFIGVGGYGPVYQGMSEKHGHIAVKRLLLREGLKEDDADIQFKTEITFLSKYKHENIASLIGFCDEDGERILVYKYESKGSLDNHLKKEDLSWTERIRICLDAARGLNYLHDDAGPLHGIIHRDIKSSNILLDENLNAKISDFGLSRLGPANTQSSFVFSNPCGTPGLIDPNYLYNGYLTEKCDVYSFGLMMCEVLSGRHAIIKTYNDEHRSLTVLFRKHYKKGTLDKIIPSYLQKDMNKYSLLTFSKIVYECLKNEDERPTMQQVVAQLEKALQSQEALEIPLKDIKSACNNFEGGNSIGRDGGARVFEGISEKHGPIFIKRFDSGQRIGDCKFKAELPFLTHFEHKDKVSFLGFCKEHGENIHVYKCPIKPSLNHVGNRFLSWIERLQICETSARILAFEYTRPNYNGYLQPTETDVYSFGVVLLEVLMGKLAYKDYPQSLPNLFREHYKKKTLDSIIPPYLLKQINPDSLATYTDIAFQCLNNNADERPTMKQVREQLQKALDQQLQSCSSSHQALKIPLQDIKSACNNFEGENFIGNDGDARVFEGISEKHGLIFIKRFDSGQGLGDHDFKTKLPMLENFEHKDKVSFLGFCKEDGENIHVYKCRINPGLDQYVDNRFLSWNHRLQICRGSALMFALPDIKFSSEYRVINDFGNQPGYSHPDYNDYQQQKSEVYSFGVTLIEVLTGRLAGKDNPQSLPNVFREHYQKKTLDSIIPPNLRKQMNPDSLATYTDIAFQCLNNVDERPTMKQVMEQLQKADDQQLQSCSSSHQDHSTELDLKATPTETDNQLTINLLEPTSLNLSEHIAR